MKKALIRWMERLKKDERGMTLVELLAVVVILAIVGVIAFVAIGNVIDNSREDAHIANAQQVISAGELYEASGGEVGSSPSNDYSNMNTIEEVIDPWDNSNSDGLSVFSISKQSGEILVESSQSQCTFGASTKAELADQGRDICD
ncbi:type II secretion system protein [Oceanobacillus locisalsi]|uniref:Type II secretion system protein n=1 Tax=Oceanobacillus locisalsi TaxID=546107 RepID=A0ABW3NJ60_9BACI